MPLAEGRATRVGLGLERLLCRGQEVSQRAAGTASAGVHEVASGQGAV